MSQTHVDSEERGLGTMKHTAAHLLILLGLTISTFAADHYICQGANGTGDGSSWSNACTDFTKSCAPGSFVRGDNYWVAAGTYSSNGISFNAADSGLSVITVQAATDSAHGSTDTGWTNGGTGNCHQGTATTGPWQISSDYWSFNGAYRGNGTGHPWLDWRTNYGFKVINNNGSGAPINSSCGICVGNGGGYVPNSNVSIKYVEVAGGNDNTGTYTEANIWITGGNSFNNYVGYSFFHDADGSSFQADSVNNFIAEYNWLQNDQSTPAHHAEGYSVRCWNGGTNNGVILRYSYIENIEGTAYIATPCTTDIKPSNWAIYGNVMFYNAAEPHRSAHQGSGDGWLSLWNFASFGGYLYVYNNSISTLDAAGGSCHHDWGGSTGQTMGDVEFYNNVYYNCTETIHATSCPGTCSSYVDDYNSYFATATTDPSPNKEVSAADPFTNVAQSVNSDDFSIVADTSMWLQLPVPYNMDLISDTRTSSRGAFQFGSGGAPNPPTSLQATVR